MKFFDQARFTQAWLADDQQQLALALPRPFPAPHQHGDFLIATHKRGQMTLPSAASAAARTDEPEQRRQLGHSLERMRAALLDDEQSGDLTLHLRGDQNSRPAMAFAKNDMMSNDLPAAARGRARQVSAESAIPASDFVD
jgi:hypothetical protein